jgi:hypothetical protein
MVGIMSLTLSCPTCGQSFLSVQYLIGSAVHCPLCRSAVPVHGTRTWWRLRSLLPVQLQGRRLTQTVGMAVLAFVLLVGCRYLDLYYSKGLRGHEDGHRRPILFGLWRLGPRDSVDVQTRFLQNIRNCGPNWGQPVWGNWTGTSYQYCLFPPPPYNHIVKIPYSLGCQKYEVEAIAYNSNTSRHIHICITQRVGPVVRDRLRGVSVVRGNLRSYGSLPSDDPRWKRWQAIAAEIDAALRDALE